MTLALVLGSAVSASAEPSRPERAAPLRARTHAVKPARSAIPPGFDRLHVEVKFQDGLELEIDRLGDPSRSDARGLGSTRARAVLQYVRRSGGLWHPASKIPRDRLRTLRARAETALGREIADLSTYFVVTLPPGAPTETLTDALNSLPEVELASPAPLPTRTPPGASEPNSSVPDFEPLQGYLDPAPGGLDARYAWTIPGGTGEGVAICDIEVGWNLDHEDLPPATVVVPDGESVSRPIVGDHGTEVLGTMVSLPNGWGTTGASHGARCLVAPAFLDSGFGVFQQILWAALQLDVGDVLLLEVGTVGPQYEDVPIEWRPDVYNAILTAVGNGIHVVEAAANGSQNLDDPIYAAGNFGHAPFLPENHSGAIMVGAGIPPTAPELGPDRSRSSFSNFGSRLDVQGWGHRVTTTGSGDLYSAEGPNRSYTRFFGGTSSAAPLVAAAIASLKGIAEAGAGTTVSPAIMRDLLIETGTPQQDGAQPASRQRIGPRPDLRTAIARMSRPVVSSPEIVRVYEGDSVHLIVDAVDLDGDPVDGLTVAPLTGGASFFTSPDHSRGVFEWATAAGQAGTYLFTFTATNTSSAIDTTRIEVLSAERGPVITGPGGVLGVEGGPPVRAAMSARDPNGDPIISFTADNLPRGASFTVDSTNTSGALYWRPDYDQAGNHVISFTAVSVSQSLGGQHQTSQGLLGLTIFDNDRAPVVTAPRSVEGSEGQSLSFTVTAEDPDGDRIVALRAENLPPGSSFQSDSLNEHGVFSWTPTFDQGFTWYPIMFTSENARQGSAVTNVHIDNTDRPPILSAPAEVAGTEGVELSFEATVEDPDGDMIIAIVAEPLPPGSQLVPNSPYAPTSARLIWTPRSGDAGRHVVTLIATAPSLAGGVLADSARVTLSIASGTFSANTSFVEGEGSIHLGSGRSQIQVRVEPAEDAFDIAEVDPSSLRWMWPEAGSQAAISAQTVTPGDQDQNGVPDLVASFSKEDLRRLFASADGDRVTATTSLRATLQGGGAIEAPLRVEVLTQRGIRDLRVTPNPATTGSVLSFYTSRSAPARVGLFDARGRLVRVILDVPGLGPGYHDVALPSSKALPAGVYYYKLETAEGSATGKLVVLR